jgi:hypothetical protein
MRGRRSAARVELTKSPADVDFGMLIGVTALSNHLICEFRDLLDRFANSQDLCNDFSMFLIEVAGHSRRPSAGARGRS